MLLLFVVLNFREAGNDVLILLLFAGCICFNIVLTLAMNIMVRSSQSHELGESPERPQFPDNLAGNRFWSSGPSRRRIETSLENLQRKAENIQLQVKGKEARVN